MNNIIELDNIEGKWIIQSTHYSLINNQLKTAIDSIYWDKIKKSNKQIPQSLIKLIDKNALNKYIIYAKKSKKNHLILYKLFLYRDQANKGEVFNLDNLGKIISKSWFNKRPDKSLYFNSQNKNFEIKEVIYFINNNLKIIKTIIQKNKQCIGISFSSEIRIT